MTVGVLAGGDFAAAPADSHIDLVSDNEAPPGPAADGRSASASRQPVRAEADANGDSSAPAQGNNQGVRLRAIDALCDVKAAVFATAFFSMLEQAGDVQSLLVLMWCAMWEVHQLHCSWCECQQLCRPAKTHCCPTPRRSPRLGGT